MRKKVTLQYIAKDAKRKASYKKRRRGLLKKVDELSTLCGVEACAIITSEYDRQPKVWPSKEGVDQVINRFNNLSEMEQTKKMVNQKIFTEERIKKLKVKLTKLRRENDHKEMTLVMNDCLIGSMSVQNLDLVKLHDLGSVIRHNLTDITMRIKDLEKESGESSLVPISTPLDQIVPMEATATSELVISPTFANQQNNTNLMQIPPVPALQGMSMADMQNFQGLPVLSPDEEMVRAQLMHGFQNAPMPPMNFSQLQNFQNEDNPIITPMAQMPPPVMHNLQQSMAAMPPFPFPESLQPWSPLPYEAFDDLMMPPFSPNDEAGPGNV